MTSPVAAFAAAAGFLLAACSGEPNIAQADPQPENVAQSAADPSAAIDPGKSLALTCSGCHGGEGEAIPDYGVLTHEELEARLLSYKQDASGTTVMHRLMRGYSDNEIAAVSRYLSTLEETH
ncbi:c-type cytochrome [Henriciella marina]|uniref:c-type cytochrome n=1 Tax=Henriciella marina TaxID=453851 RepID=UPI00036700AC|nr:c-type cytochrome [Henriciella marina]